VGRTALPTVPWRQRRSGLLSDPFIFQFPTENSL